MNGTNAEFVINAAASVVTVNGDGGQLKVIDAHNLSVDTRRMQVEIETTVAAWRLNHGDHHAKSRSASRSGRRTRFPSTPSRPAARSAHRILISMPVTEAREARLNTVVGKPVARLVLRNSRGDIVISKRK